MGNVTTSVRLLVKGKQTKRPPRLSLPDENTTVTEYATRWVETYKRTTVSKPVYSEYVHRINDIIIPAIGPLKMKNIKPTHLQEIMNAHADKSKSYCSKLLVIIHGIFRQAVKDEIIRRDPSEAVKEPKTKSGTHRSNSRNCKNASIWSGGENSPHVRPATAGSRCAEVV